MSLPRYNRGTSNRLLLALPPPVFERLWPKLQPVELARRQVLHAVNRPILHLYFIERGLISLVKTMHDGRMIEIGAVGIEGAAGANAILGVSNSVLDSIVHIPGKARRISWTTLRNEMSMSTALRDLMLRYAHFRITQLAQSAACNRLHSLEQRCSRWLLIAHDSARSDSFPITHEFLAMMLGVQRTGVSLAANVLQKAKLIRCGRGRVTIIDRAGLEAMACECYGVIRTELDDLFAS